MCIERWSQDVILVDLPEELRTHDELQAVIAMLRGGGDCGVVVDFRRWAARGWPDSGRSRGWSMSVGTG